MSASPLQFAREFAKLKTDLSKHSVPELHLLCLMEFWHKIEPLVTNPAYQSYLDEYIPLFHSLISEQTLSDFTIEELSNLRQILLTLDKLEQSNPEFKWIEQKLRLVSYKLASTLFYVGDIEKAIPICCNLSGVDENVALPDDDILAGLDAYDSLRVLAETFKSSKQPLTAVLNDIYQRWEAERVCVSDDKAVCLFVEKNHEGKAERGRLKALSGTVELREINDETDTVAFDNQIKTPDDPFIGAAYDSLKAVRDILKKTGFNNKSERSYRAFFSIDESQQTFTGDSIGLAMGLVSYAQLLKDEIMRQQRFISNEVALTGGIDKDGKLLPVNMETLRLKIERAFFSPVKYLAVPKDCYADAEKHIDKLSETYPRRQLQLIAHSHLVNVIDDLNILRSEKVCMSQYITKKVVKYSRAAKIQVPILLAMLYFIICLIFPKAWVGFDWNPQYVMKTNTGFIALNAEKVQLWAKDFGCEIEPNPDGKVGDINDDGKNEVAFVPRTVSINDNNANLFVYDHKGKLLFRRFCPILNEYPGDTLAQTRYYSSTIDFAKGSPRRLIITHAYQSYPARTHFKIWSVTGDSLGWYINAGAAGGPDYYMQNDDGRLLFMGTNNRMQRPVMFALSPDSCYGVSPPYEDDSLDLGGVKRGNQQCYILFPCSDMAIFNKLYPYEPPLCFSIEPGDIIKVDITANFYEKDKPQAVISYSFNKDYRLINIQISDSFIARRNELVMRELLPSVDWSTYQNHMRDSVTYWTDSGWVTEAELRASEKK